MAKDRAGVLHQMEEAARRLTVPTLMVRGAKSDIVSQASVDAFMKLVPHARLVDVGGAGHMVAGDKNDVFANAILDFLG